MSDLAEHLMKTAKAMNEIQMVQFRRDEAHRQDLLCRLTQYRQALGALVKECECMGMESAVVIYAQRLLES